MQQGPNDDQTVPQTNSHPSLVGVLRTCCLGPGGGRLTTGEVTKEEHLGVLRMVWVGPTSGERKAPYTGEALLSLTVKAKEKSKW